MLSGLKFDEIYQALDFLDFEIRYAYFSIYEHRTYLTINMYIWYSCTSFWNIMSSSMQKELSDIVWLCFLRMCFSTWEMNFFDFYWKIRIRSSCCDLVITNPTSIHKDAGSIPSLTQWVGGSGLAMSCGVGHRCSSDPVLLWCVGRWLQLWFNP